MRQNSLLNVRQMFKAECGASLNTTVSTISDNQFNYFLYNTQNWLASENDWPFLRTLIDVPIPGGTQYTALPSLNYERATSLVVEVFYNQIYQPVQYGIDSREYNISNFALQQTQVPVERWSFSDENDFEVWPVSLQGQTMRFTGQRPITTLFSAGTTFSDAALLDLDDLLVVYFAAAKYLQQLKDPSAQDMLAKATKRMNDVRAAYPKREGVVIVRGEAMDDHRRIRAVPIVTVAPRS